MKGELQLRQQLKEKALLDFVEEAIKTFKNSWTVIWRENKFILNVFSVTHMQEKLLRLSLDITNQSSDQTAAVTQENSLRCFARKPRGLEDIDR